MKLAYLVEQSKKKNIPSGTVKAFLEKMQSAKVNLHNVWINIQGPNGCLLVFHLVTDNVTLTKHNVNTMLRKNMYVDNHFLFHVPIIPLIHSELSKLQT